MNIKELKLDYDTLFTSDLHLNHSNIIKYCNRPYDNIDEMNESIINNWNSVANENSTIVVLGDILFCNGSTRDSVSLLNELNGDIILVLGNHDYRNIKYLEKSNRFRIITNFLRAKIGDWKVLCNHYPLLCYERKDTTLNLFGHVHSGPCSTSEDLPRLENLYKTQYDVGVDNNDYTPRSFEWILNKLEL